MGARETHFETMFLRDYDENGNEGCTGGKGDCRIMKKTKMKDLIVLWIALAALVCAALALNRSLNQLISKESE